MKIYDTDFKWRGALMQRKLTEAIILHHMAGHGDVLTVHNSHINNGWSGIGYHFYIRTDGSIYRGRPVDKVGAHSEDNNSYSIGICFEGNFEKENMTEKQIASGKWLIAHIEECYGKRMKILKHSDVCATSCPGKNFPFDEITKVSKDELVSKMYSDGVISIENVKNWELFLSGKAKPNYKWIRAIIERYQRR